MPNKKVTEGNFVVIQSFMINQLGLTGVPLLVYAIIYGFSQNGENEFTSSLQYLCDFTGKTKPTVIKILKELVEKQYIIRREEEINNVKFVRYKANLPLLKKFNGGSKETLPGVVKKFNGGSKETLPININNKDKYINKENNKGENDEKKTFPTLDSEFDSLWRMYPRKIGRSNAFAAYKKAKENGVTYEQVEKAIKAYCAYIKKEKIEERYIITGSQWFVCQHWTDEYSEPSKAEKGTIKGKNSVKDWIKKYAEECTNE